jgi:hypothetical protein
MLLLVLKKCWRREVYWSICELLKQRVEKAGSLNKGDKMDREKVAIRNGKAFKTNEVTVKADLIDARYKSSIYSNKKITDTGRLIIGELKPQDETLPGFLFRWDEKDDRFDVDITNVSKNKKRKFEHGEGGYRGHHPRRIHDEENRTFEVDIKIPDFQVFKGKISFKRG